MIKSALHKSWPAEFTFVNPTHFIRAALRIQRMATQCGGFLPPPTKITVELKTLGKHLAHGDGLFPVAPELRPVARNRSVVIDRALRGQDVNGRGRDALGTRKADRHGVAVPSGAIVPGPARPDVHDGLPIQKDRDGSATAEPCYLLSEHGRNGLEAWLVLTMDLDVHDFKIGVDDAPCKQFGASESGCGATTRSSRRFNFSFRKASARSSEPTLADREPLA